MGNYDHFISAVKDVDELKIINCRTLKSNEISSIIKNNKLRSLDKLRIIKKSYSGIENIDDLIKAYKGKETLTLEELNFLILSIRCVEKKLRKSADYLAEFSDDYSYYNYIRNSLKLIVLKEAFGFSVKSQALFISNYNDEYNKIKEEYVLRKQ